MKTKFRNLTWFVIGAAVFPTAALPAYAEAPLPRPLTLDAALAYVVEHNPALLRKSESIREQEGVLIQARAAQLPTVAASGSYSRREDSLLESPFYERRSWTIDVTARQLLYAGGGTRAQIRSERERFEAARLGFTAALNDTILTLRQEFHAVLLDREIIAVHEEALRVLETALDQARARRDVGTGSDFDVLRAEVSVANEKPALIRARNAYRVAQDQLRGTLGAPPMKGAVTDLDVQGLLALPHRNVDLDAALSAAQENRPELAQQKRLIAAAEQGVRSARSGYQPTVSAIAGYEWIGPSMTTTADNRLSGWTAGVQSSWAIFDGRATAAKVRQSQSRLKQAKFSVTELELAVELDVRRAFSSLSEADELLSTSEKVVDQARESLRLAQARLQAGTATQLDILQAQSALTEARSNLAQAQYAYVVATASLQRAVGSH
jgi:TolC family type I secretion outer membrane protein